MAKKQALFDTLNSLKSDFNSFDIESTRFIQIRDDNNQNYNSNYVRFDSSSAIDKSVDYIDCAGSFLFLPHQIVLKGVDNCTFDNDALNDFSACIKTSVLNLINSVLVKLGNSQKQVTDNASYANLLANFTLLHMSEDQIRSIGDLIGFVPDNGASQFFQTADGPYGVQGSLTNNKITKSDKEYTGVNNMNKTSNDGLRARLQKLNINPSNINSIVDSSSFKSMRKTFISRDNIGTAAAPNNAMVLKIYSLIPLPLIHDLFAKLPVCRGLGINLTLNLNINHKTRITLEAGGASYESFSVSSSNVSNMCPYNISELTFVKTSATTAGDPRIFTIENCINKDLVNESCWLYMKTIKYGAEMEKKLLDSGKVTVMYEDYATVVGNQDFSVNSNASINKIRVATVARPRKLIVIPQLNASENAADVTMQIAPYATPFSTAPFNTPRHAFIKSFNVFKNGTPLYNQASEYTYDNYLEAVQGSIDGMQVKNLGTPSNTKIINPESWHNGLNYYVSDLTTHTKTKTEDNIPCEIAVSLNNATTKKMDYMFIVTRQKEMVIDINSGTFEMIQE